ncbi:MAG: hypothetical protein K6L75_06630 [Cellvibrionaceae bacterium]
MIRFYFLSFLWLVFSSNTYPGETGPWELQISNNSTSEVTLYFRNYPDSKIPEFKAITTIQSTMASVLAVLLDYDACKKWVHQCEHSFSIQSINSREQYIYQINKLPFVKDRDVILHATLFFSEEAKNITIKLIADPDFCSRASEELSENCKSIDPSRYVRVTTAIGHYELKEIGNNIQVTWQQYLEPGGFLPNWLAKSQLSDLPIKTLMTLHKIVKEEKYQNTSLRMNNQELQLTYYTEKSG